jgi:hypothetical protein
MTPRSRALAYGAAAALVVAGVLCAVLVGGTAGGVLSIILIGCGAVGAVALVFLEVGLSEDRDRREDDRRP